MLLINICFVVVLRIKFFFLLMPVNSTTYCFIVKLYYKFTKTNRFMGGVSVSTTRWVLIVSFANLFFKINHGSQLKKENHMNVKVCCFNFNFYIVLINFVTHKKTVFSNELTKCCFFLFFIRNYFALKKIMD